MNLLKKIIYSNILPTLGKVVSYKNKFINVIYYHDIVEGNGYSYMKTDEENFIRQMELIKQNNFKTLQFQDLDDPSNLEFSSKSILITFDDGWKSNYNRIFNYMLNNEIKFNIFLAIGKIGTDSDYLTWEDIRIMNESGLVDFGVHTYNHVELAKVNEAILKEEIDFANQIFKDKLGFNPSDFCFPCGAYTVDSLQKIIARGCYKRLYTSDMDYSKSIGDVIVFGRNGVHNEDNDKVFLNKVKGNFNIFKSIRRISHTF